MATVHFIRGKGNPPPFRDIYEEVRWIEFVYYPGQSMESRLETLRNTSRHYPFSIYKTHKNPPEFNIRDDAFYIVKTRNPIDAIASLEPFLRNHLPGFAKMWGGFPMSAGEAENPGTLIEYEKFLFEDIGSGKSGLDVLILDPILGFWEFRNKSNVLFLHYTDRMKDHKGQIARIAKFLGVDLSSEELNLVAKNTDFKAMKRDASKYNLAHVFDAFRGPDKVPDFVTTMLSPNVLVNMGPERDAKAVLPEYFIEKAKRVILDKTGPKIYKWFMEGGEFPADSELQ